MENGWESTGNPPSKGFLDVLDLPMILATFQKVDFQWIPGGFPVDSQKTNIDGSHGSYACNHEKEIAFGP